MHARSLRLKLALTYAGMALLTALLLGGILLGVLAQYFARSEDRYLRAGAEFVTAAPPPVGTPSLLTGWVQTASLQTQTRVRVYDAGGGLLADSGTPGAAGPGMMMHDGQGYGPGSGHRMPGMFGRGLFGGASDARSDRTLTVSLAGADGASVQLSEAPASGSNALVSAAQAWALAAALAVALAALGGWLVAARIARPVVELTQASDRMAEGDLGARASVTRSDEVGRLAESFNAMAGRVEGTVATLRRFVADAAHEIGTPLTALQADLELAERAATGDDERRLVERALVQTDRLGTLSGNLLQLSRLEAGEAGAAGARLDMVVLAREAADAVASRAEQAGLDLRLDITPDPCPVVAERSDLQTVLGNLLDNAVKFTAEGGRVTLSVRTEGDAVVVAVADTGVGIPAAERGEIFGRFHRARNVAAYPGNGLGLAVVKAAIERNRGSVSFESAETGTEFRVSLLLA